MIPEYAVWAIFFLPLGSAAIIGLFIRPFLNQYRYASSLILIASLTVALCLSIWTLDSVIDNGEALSFTAHHWLTVGNVEVDIGLLVNNLTAIMLIVVTGVSLMVQIYSHGYMRDDQGYARYFAFMSLFSASMIGLVIASNVIQLYVFWELVGLSSYLLIGFWFHRPAAAAAAKKAFIITRIGDFGFLLAILFLFFHNADYLTKDLNFLDITDVNTGAEIAVLTGGAATFLAIAIFCGGLGKSGQFPLHVWLPDAMEGPTPVSALIHAATMVAAGVFLVARFFPVFEASPDAMNTVAIVGAFTAFFASTMGLVMNDIKRVLAYSTISQLGFMMAALGIGAYEAALFHLFNHAFFKALLFLGAGNVNHATGTFDMRYMGGLRKSMPITYIAMLLGGLSLAGIFPLSGFWSKDEILRHASDGVGSIDAAVFWLLLIAVFLTAVYTFRMIYQTFHGEFRGGIDRELSDQGKSAPIPASHGVHLAESPLIMLAPMAVLTVGAVASGYLTNPEKKFLGIDAHWLTGFLGDAAEGVEVSLAAIVMLIAVAGIGLATGLYLYRGIQIPRILMRPMTAGYFLLSRKYFIDYLYEEGVVRRFYYRIITAIADWFDRIVIDGVADAIGIICRNIGKGISHLQTGQVQSYGVAISLGVVSILVGYLIWG